MPTVTEKEKKKKKARWNNISHYLLFTYAYIIFLAKKKMQAEETMWIISGPNQIIFSSKL